MIFFQKRIKGTVISCNGCREWFSKASLGCRFIDSEYLYEPEYSAMNNYADCFVFYRSIVFSYVLCGNVKRIELKNVSFPCQYKEGDSVTLIYNRLNRAVYVRD